jgi:hypothetical protein
MGGEMIRYINDEENNNYGQEMYDNQDFTGMPLTPQDQEGDNLFFNQPHVLKD